MENQGDVAKLFFELASDSRLSILFTLKDKKLKMQEIARQLDVTATEAFRQLERLSVAMLVARQPNGEYTLTSYGGLVLHLTSPLSFILKHKNFFATHDISRLPYEFVNRLGELSGATLIVDTMESLNKGELLFIQMAEYGWGMAEGVVPELMGPVMEQQLQKGIKMRFIVPDSKLPPNPNHLANLETRSVPEIPAIIALSEKEALVGFRTKEGKVDYTVFYGSDAVFVGWVRSLFLFYWDKGRRF